MTFTEEQIKTLAAWDENFRTAVNAQWARNPGTSGLKVIWTIFTQATGDKRRFNDDCNHCILSLLADCGKLYFKDLSELETRKSTTKEVKVSLEEKEVVKKAKIITPKTYKKTKK